jgi:hypothetical protein
MAVPVSPETGSRRRTESGRFAGRAFRFFSDFAAILFLNIIVERSEGGGEGAGSGGGESGELVSAGVWRLSMNHPTRRDFARNSRKCLICSVRGFPFAGKRDTIVAQINANELPRG